MSTEPLPDVDPAPMEPVPVEPAAPLVPIPVELESVLPVLVVEDSVRLVFLRFLAWRVGDWVSELVPIPAVAEVSPEVPAEPIPPVAAVPPAVSAEPAELPEVEPMPASEPPMPEAEEPAAPEEPDVEPVPEEPLMPELAKAGEARRAQSPRTRDCFFIIVSLFRVFRTRALLAAMWVPPERKNAETAANMEIPTKFAGKKKPAPPRGERRPSLNNY